MQKVLPLSDRVRAALSEPTTSDAVKALIEAAGFELESVRQRLQAAKAKAVDPMSPDAEAAEARREHHDLGFEEERQTSSIARLKHRLAAVIEDEAEERRRVAYEALKKDHGALADKLRERYPALAQELAGILSEVQAMNARTTAVNRNLPSEAHHMLPVEHVVRGPVAATYPYGPDPIYQRPESLVRAVSLPKLDSQEAKGTEGYLWLGLEKAD